MKLNKYFFIGIIGLILLPVSMAIAQPMGQSLWYPDTGLHPVDSNWHIGTSALPIPKGWFTDLSVAGAFTLSGTVGTGGINMNGENIALNGGYVSGDGDDEGIYVDSSGNVGIGTTSPLTLTEIQGGLTTTGAILTLSSKETSTVLNDVLGRINFRAALDAAGTDAILTGASIVARAEGTFSSSSNATSLDFQTGSSEVATTKMTIMSSGNVGIGTTSPGAKLNVVGGNVLIDNTKAYQIKQSSGTAINALIMDSSNHLSLVAGVAGSIKLYPDAGNDGAGLTVINGGNVGIGTTSPDTKLHVLTSGTSSFTGAVNRGITITDNLGPRLMFDDAGEGANDRLALMRYEDESIKFSSLLDDGSTDTENILVLNRDGNVGIGTTGPDAPLDVLGTTTQMRLTYTDGSVYAGFSVDSSGNLEISPTGKKTTIDNILKIQPQATAPATCSIGEIYVDTSGGYCACSITNTWENLSANGSCE